MGLTNQNDSLFSNKFIDGAKNTKAGCNLCSLIYGADLTFFYQDRIAKGLFVMQCWNFVFCQGRNCKKKIK
jgi:hypothetical protein